ERELSNADPEPSFPTDRLRAVQSAVQRLEPVPYRLGQVRDQEVFEMAAEGQGQSLLDRAVRNELADRGFESLTEMLHSRASEPMTAPSSGMSDRPGEVAWKAALSTDCGARRNERRTPIEADV